MNDLLLPNNSGQNPTIMHNAHGLELVDFLDDANGINDEFVNRESFAGDQFDHYLCSTSTTHHDLMIDGCLVDDDHHDLMIDGCLVDDDHHFGVLNDLPISALDDHEHVQEDNNDDQSSETAAKTDKPKRDRSKTLISERGRRGRMKEKLYALRSLVPNITKMDKASIVGDAARYVRELQMQAKKLRDEIQGLEASYNYKNYSNNNVVNYLPTMFHQLPMSKNVIQMDIFQVEERGFYMRLVCNKGDGVAMSLYKVLESLTSLNARSSNLASATDTLELTVTLRVKDCVKEISLPDLKLWVVGALCNEGFEFKSSLFP